MERLAKAQFHNGELIVWMVPKFGPKRFRRVYFRQSTAMRGERCARTRQEMWRGTDCMRNDSERKVFGPVFVDFVKAHGVWYDVDFECLCTHCKGQSGKYPPSESAARARSQPSAAGMGPWSGC